MQRAAVADVEIVVGAVAQGERAGHFEPAVQVLVGAGRTDGGGRPFGYQGASAAGQYPA